jgi:hypothetical protein
MNPEPAPLTKRDLLDIAQKWQEKLNIKTNRIQIVKMKKKWSSCSTKGNITLNSELTKLPKEIAEYAILHELLHIIEPNHGKAFKAMLSAYLPHWQELHDKLAMFQRKNEKAP